MQQNVQAPKNILEHATTKLPACLVGKQILTNANSNCKCPGSKTKKYGIDSIKIQQTKQQQQVQTFYCA